YWGGGAGGGGRLLSGARAADSAQVQKSLLSALDPPVASPQNPANTTPISRLQEMIARSQREPTPDFCTVDDDTITDAFLGSCTNARYEDLVAGAAIMRGHTVHPPVNLTAIPPTPQPHHPPIPQ